MKIRRVILKGVRNFKDFDRSIEDEWSGRVPDSLLLIGPNGSGKTTLLNAVADMWQMFANHLRQDQTLSSSDLPLMGETLSNSELAAIEILDLEDEPVWICMGNEYVCKQFMTSRENDHRVLSLRSDAPGRQYLDYTRPGAKDGQAQRFSNIWQQKWAERLEKNVLGSKNDLPNIVYLESETRFLPTLTEKFSTIRESEEYRWLARYEPTTSRKGSLQNYLYNLKVRDEEAFEKIVKQANSFLSGKHLDKFDRRSGSLMVQVDSGGEHSIEDLSSGEKQVLLMLATITRWLRPGGIVLIDEPDLHLHDSLTTAFVSHLRRMVAEVNGQLFLASHASVLWRQEFTEAHQVRLGTVEMEQTQ